jgi:D-xylulose reductase
VLTDVQQPKLDLATKLGPIRPVNVAKENLRQVIDELTEGWGADLVFEATGAPAAIQKVRRGNQIDTTTGTVKIRAI